MIHIAIVEDEDVWAEKINHYLKKYEIENQIPFHISRFHDGAEIADDYSGGHDIIFMDIEMGLMNGMEAAEQIRTKDEQVIIIFVTNMSQYAIRGYKVNALDYVLKPITYIPFSQTLKKAIRSVSKTKENYITISMRNGISKIRTDDIYWIESHGHRLTFHTLDGKQETTVYSMKEMENKLSAEGFKRCNSGSLINLKRVESIQNGYIEIGGTLLPVSRGRKADFMSALVSYMTE